MLYNIFKNYLNEFDVDIIYIMHFLFWKNIVYILINLILNLFKFIFFIKLIINI